MALTPQNEEAFFREVDEELRRDQVATLWRRYGRLGVGLLAVFLAGLGAFLWWQADREKRAGAEGETLVQALNDLSQGRPAGVPAKLDTLAASSHPAYRASAMLTKAALAVDKGDIKGAIAQFKLVADNPDLPQPFRDLARIRQTALEYDMLPPATIVERLKPLAMAGSPWFGSAGEMVAIAYMEMNKPALAGPLFAAIAKDGQVPETIRGRATRIAAALGTDVTAQVAATKEITE